MIWLLLIGCAALVVLFLWWLDREWEKGYAARKRIWDRRPSAQSQEREP